SCMCAHFRIGRADSAVISSVAASLLGFYSRIQEYPKSTEGNYNTKIVKMMRIQSYPNQKNCVNSQRAPMPQLENCHNVQMCNRKRGNMQRKKITENAFDQIQCNLKQAHNQIRELCNNDDLMDKTVQEDFRSMQEILLSMQAPDKTQTQECQEQEDCNCTQSQDPPIQEPYQFDPDYELTERSQCNNMQPFEKLIQGKKFIQQAIFSIVKFPEMKDDLCSRSRRIFDFTDTPLVYRYTAGCDGPQTQGFSMQETCENVQTCDNMEPPDLLLQMTYDNDQPVDLAPPQQCNNSSPESMPILSRLTALALFDKKILCIFTFQKILMMHKPKMGLQEVSNYFAIATILSFIHPTAPCEKASSEESTEGHDENNNALCSTPQQNDEAQQPDEPQNDPTACGGITDVDLDALMAEQDAQCVESYAVALRFFSYFMGQTDIDATVLERPPVNELLLKLRDYQKLIMDMLSKDSRQMVHFDPEFLRKTDITPEMRSDSLDWLIKMQESLSLLDEDLHVVMAMIDLMLCEANIMRCDYPLLLLTTIWCVRSGSRTGNTLALEELLRTFGYRYTEQEVLAMGIMMRSKIESFVPVVTPWHFFNTYSLGSMDIPRKQRVMFDDACNYVFELGLTEEMLAHYAANLRCCAVIYLIRRIFRRHCFYLPDHEEYHTRRTRCPCCTLPDWSELLALITGMEETLELKQLAHIYCVFLCRARNFVAIPEHAHIYRAAFDKYNTAEKHFIASNRLLTNGNMQEVFPAITP
ncbi:Cyclin-B2-2, partial [Taenia solium]